jgi:hypothetical protein
LHRRVGQVTGGVFHGDRLAGEVLGEGSDWQMLRRDGAVFLDVRLLLRTRDDATIAATYRGVRRGQTEVLERLDRAEAVDPSEYYFRINPIFETGDPR